MRHFAILLVRLCRGWRSWNYLHRRQCLWLRGCLKQLQKLSASQDRITQPAVLLFKPLCTLSPAVLVAAGFTSPLPGLLAPACQLRKLNVFLVSVVLQRGYSCRERATRAFCLIQPRALRSQFNLQSMCMLLCSASQVSQLSILLLTHLLQCRNSHSQCPVRTTGLVQQCSLCGQLHFKRAGIVLQAPTTCARRRGHSIQPCRLQR
mmetsp:Transcript_129341/g.251834  ORF Transcript_129341/g.251834 Transcript_129341/m.251834 type:complete len:206 (-) Transcript_129341:73-690(-)